MFIFILQRCLLKEDSIEEESAEEGHSVHPEIVLQPVFEDSEEETCNTLIPWLLQYMSSNCNPSFCVELKS